MSDLDGIDLLCEDAISVWYELERALAGKSGYGGDVTEIYAYRLARPMLQRPNDEEQARVAGANMTRLLRHFVQLHEGVVIAIQEDRDEFRPLDLAQDFPAFAHRVHLRVSQAVSLAEASRAKVPCTEPIQRGFEYEVRLAVSIPLAWAALLKAASKHHYDHRCNEAGRHGVINGLYNTACDSEYPSNYPVTWRDLDLTTKVAEQLEYHTNDHVLVRAIRAWLRETMGAIARQRDACMKLPGSSEDLT